MGLFTGIWSRFFLRFLVFFLFLFVLRLYYLYRSFLDSYNDVWVRAKFRVMVRVRVVHVRWVRAWAKVRLGVHVRVKKCW